MKGLLHSKVFKRNLRKWVFMYVGVMCLATSVITYSRYITSMQSTDRARVASFKVIFDYNNICEHLDATQACDYGSHRPTSEYDFYFTVDTRELEVKSLLVTRISLNDDFKNLKLYDITDGINEYINGENGYINKDNSITITEEITKSNQYVRKYKLTASFNEDINTTKDKYDTERNYNDALIIGYSATQVS